MRLSIDHLRRYAPALPEGAAARHLLDDVGVEVKRWEPGPEGTVASLELLANRGDHRCYMGVAREVVGRLGGALCPPALATLDLGPCGLPLEVQSPLCLLYTATPLDVRDPAAALGEEALLPLRLSGLHSISPAVDATNLSNLELGQPTHAFDADTLVGGVVVRESVAGERAWPLFAAGPVELEPGTLVIADQEKILAVAGVIGCEESKVTERTRRILLESATFDPVSVRIAGRRLRVHTDSLARFERGADPEAALQGAARVVSLLEGCGYARRAGPTERVGAWTDPERSIHLDLSAASAHLHQQLGAEEAAERLARYGYRCAPASGGFTVQVPSWRLWDVSHREDLYEDLARSIGYNALPTALPAVSMGASLSPEEELRQAIEGVLLPLGYYEVITDGFYSRAMVQRLGFTGEHALAAHVETQNALDRGYSLLKNNALVQAIELVVENARHQVEQVRAFEFTRTFHVDPSAPNGVNRERKLVWAIASGAAESPNWASHPEPMHIHALKGLIEELALELRRELRLAPLPAEHPLASALHPYRRAAILCEGQPVGLLGEVDPGLVAALGLRKARPCYLELELERLSLRPERPTWELPPLRPPSHRDLAFTLPGRMEAGEVAAALQAAGPAWLRSVAITDLYRHEEAGQPLRTVTFQLRYENDHSERSIEEMNATTESLVAAALAVLGPRGLRQRA